MKIDLTLQNITNLGGGSVRTKRVIFHLMAFSISLLVLFSRRPDALLNAQFFAEDGRYWFADAYQFGWSCLLMPQSGYLNTLSRLIALLSVLFPLAIAPLVMNLCAMTFQILPVNLLLSSRFDVVPFQTRLFGGLLYLALPNSAEVHANTTNVQWHLGLLAFLVLAAPSRSALCKYLFDFPVILLISLNGPLGILLVPIAALFWWNRKDKTTAAYLAALVPGAVLQTVIVVTSHARRLGANGATLYRFVSILGRQVFMGSLLGSRMLDELVHRVRFLFALELIATMMGLAMLLYALRYSPLELRLFIIFSSLIVATSLARPLVVQPGYQWEIMRGAGNFGRYFFVPMLAFLAVLVWLVQSAKAHFLHYAALGILLLMPIGVVKDWRYPPFQDLDFRGFAAAFDHAAPGTRFIILINPNWEMQLTKKP